MEDNIRKPDVVTVAVTRVDGGLTILQVVSKEYIPDPNDSTKRIVWREYNVTPEYIQSIINRYVNDKHWEGPLLPVSWRVVPNEFVKEDIDDYFRNAWKDTGKHEPDIDMPKAKEIHKEKLRMKRTSLLEKLDAEYMRADEASDAKKKKEIADKKQQLRDITNHPDIEVAKTPEQLKAVWPEILNEI